MVTATRLTLAYPALFTPEEDGYSIAFPDLEGCFSEGDTFDEARSNAREALSGYLESIFIRGFVIPPVTDPASLDGDVHLIKPLLHVSVPLLIRLARTQAGLTQEEVAQEIGTSYQNYQRWENPRTCNISLKNLEKLCEILNCELM